MSEVKLQVFLLAENRLFREALTRLLNKKVDVRVVGADAFSAGVFERIAELRPDILLSDSKAISLSDLQIVPQLRKLLPGLKVVMIGMDPDHKLFLHAVQQGAVGYVLKDASAMEVAAAVRAVMNAQPQVKAPTARVKRELGLSRREQQLTNLISEGLTNKEIASQLNLSEQTVKNHVHRMLRKVGTTDRLVIVERWREARSAQYESPAVPVPKKPQGLRLGSA